MKIKIYSILYSSSYIMLFILYTAICYTILVYLPKSTTILNFLIRFSIICVCAVNVLMLIDKFYQKINKSSFFINEDIVKTTFTTSSVYTMNIHIKKKPISYMVKIVLVKYMPLQEEEVRTTMSVPYYTIKKSIGKNIRYADDQEILYFIYSLGDEDAISFIKNKTNLIQSIRTAKLKDIF